MALTAEWIRTVLVEQQPESQRLDFKREPPGADDRSKKNFLTDVVAMANATGGHLIFGIEERDGKAHALQSVPKAEAVALGLGQTISLCVEPRLSNVGCSVIEVDGAELVVVSIGMALNGPFRTAYQGKGDFYIRQGAQNQRMTYDQLRSGFGQRAALVASMKAWRSARLDVIRRNVESGTLWTRGAWAITHVMPLESFGGERSLDLVAAGRTSSEFFGPHTPNIRYNLDGLRFQLEPGDQFSVCQQVFRAGHVEAGRTIGHMHQGPGVVGSGKFAEAVRWSIHSARSLHSAHGFDGPVACALSVLGVDGWKLSNTEGWDTPEGSSPERDLIIEEVVVDALDDAAAADRVVNQLLDVAWQGFGLSHCPFFRQGKWHAPKQYS